MGELEDAVCEVTNQLLNGKPRIKLLEAGCGSYTHIKFNPEVYAVGIDISKEQLERNVTVQEKILGDLEQYPLPRDEFDVAICWMVLEHLPNPQQAMRNMFDCVKPGGLVILGFPNLLSIKGSRNEIYALLVSRAVLQGHELRESALPHLLSQENRARKCH